MTHRKTMGFAADAAESAELTMVDEYAEKRMLDFVDRHEERKAEADMIAAALRRIERNLGSETRIFARKVLNGKNWRDMGIAKSTFYDTLKKVEKLLSCP